MSTRTQNRLIMAFSHDAEEINARTLRERTPGISPRAIADAVTDGFVAQKNTLGGAMYRPSIAGVQLRAALSAGLGSK